jgi:hypothetical protein
MIPAPLFHFDIPEKGRKTKLIWFKQYRNIRIDNEKEMSDKVCPNYVTSTLFTVQAIYNNSNTFHNVELFEQSILVHY